MRRQRWRGAAINLVLGVVLVAGLVITTQRVKSLNNRSYLHTNLYLPSGKFIEQAALGYRELAADMIWFSAVQYYGNYRLERHDLSYFEGLINIVTDLDPYFVFPYSFGGVVMAEDMHEFDRGIAILKKGMVNNPRKWEFPFEIGFLHYVVGHDNASAGRYFELASRLPGGGDRSRRFAAFVYSKAGHESNSIRMWEEILESADEPFLRDLARRSIERLRAHEAGGHGDS